jgi:LmbE family N-acetylglucosaminyl deacetylase
MSPPSDASDVGHLPRIGTLLGVWAHPDDEACLSSGLMSRVRNHGGRVVVVTATRGQLGADDPAHPAGAGVSERHWLQHRDGTLDDVPISRGAAELVPVIEDVAPDVIVTFGPGGMTGHADHRAIWAWTTEAWCRTGRQAELWYAAPPVTHPAELSATVRLTGSLLARKCRALRPSNHTWEDVGCREWWSTERFVSAPRVGLACA